MSALIDLRDATRSGAYFVGPGDLDTLDAAAHEDGLLARRASLLGCRDKTDLLAQVAAALKFPPTFGNNWDALADCLRDLSWLATTGGVVLLLDHAGDMRDAAEADFDTALDIFDDAATTWKANVTPFFVFLALPDDAFPVSR